LELELNIYISVTQHKFIVIRKSWHKTLYHWATSLHICSLHVKAFEVFSLKSKSELLFMDSQVVAW